MYHACQLFNDQFLKSKLNFSFNFDLLKTTFLSPLILFSVFVFNVLKCTKIFNSASGGEYIFNCFKSNQIKSRKQNCRYNHEIILF